MNGLVFHIASGQAFFTGAGAIVIAGLSVLLPYQRVARFSVLFLVVGLIFVVLSSSAIPTWIYVLCAAASVSWIASQVADKRKKEASLCLICIWILAIACELPYHVVASLEPVSDRSLLVVGDSVTAGSGAHDQSVRWPELFAVEHNIAVTDVSHMGETASSALNRIQKRRISSPVVLLEIGGNDLLGSTPPEEFERDLDALIQHVSSQNRQVVMFELPLPPFNNRYGCIQRELAHQHQVILVPKRMFLSVIAGGDATMDTIHLTQAGHEKMAEVVWYVLKSGYR